MKLDTKRVALAGGIIWSALIFFTTLLGAYLGSATAFLNGMASIYPDYSISLGGSVIGSIYGFFDVFIGVYIFAWVYTKLGR